MGSSQLDNLLVDWKVRLTKAQVGHYMASEKYMKLHHILGIFLVISSAFVSSSLFQQQTSNVFNYIVIGTSLASTILASLQTFIRPSEKAEIHRSKASKYGVLRRKLELFSSVNHPENEISSFLDRLHEDWNSIAGDAPLTPRNIRKQITNILKVELDEDRQLKDNNNLDT